MTDLSTRNCDPVPFPPLPKGLAVGEIHLVLATDRGCLLVESTDEGGGVFVTLKTEDSVALDPDELGLLGELGAWLSAMHEGAA